jgi:hypothetical protein
MLPIIREADLGDQFRGVLLDTGKRPRLAGAVQFRSHQLEAVFCPAAARAIRCRRK